MDKSFPDLLRRHRTFLIPFLILILICFYFLFTNTQAELFLITNIVYNDFFDEVFKVFTILGDGSVMVLVTFAMLFVKYRYAVLLAISYGFTSVIVQILKRIFNSPRPSKFFEGLNPIRTIEGYPLYEWNSFPSGHSTSAFVLAVCLSYMLPHKGRHWIIIPIAILTAFSRVYLSQHFLHDVVAGAILGVMLTFQVIWWLEKSEWFNSSRLDGRLFS